MITIRHNLGAAEAARRIRQALADRGAPFAVPQGTTSIVVGASTTRPAAVDEGWTFEGVFRFSAAEASFQPTVGEVSNLPGRTAANLRASMMSALWTPAYAEQLYNAGQLPPADVAMAAQLGLLRSPGLVERVSTWAGGGGTFFGGPPANPGGLSPRSPVVRAVAWMAAGAGVVVGWMAWRRWRRG